MRNHRNGWEELAHRIKNFGLMRVSSHTRIEVNALRRILFLGQIEDHERAQLVHYGIPVNAWEELGDRPPIVWERR